MWTQVSIQKSNTVRSKVFNFHGITLVIIMKLKTKSSQKVDKKSTGNDGNLMFIRMNKMLFLHTNISKLNKSINKEVLHSYNNSCIPQMVNCRVALINKCIRY